CLELQLAVYETLHVGARERLLYARQPFRIAEAARFQHVAEDVDALPPVLQVARQEPEVAIVLERLLELVRGEKMVEVARLHALRQRFELPVPAGGVPRVARQELVEQRTARDLLDGRVDAARLGMERLDRAMVMVDGLARGIELR